MTSRTSTDVITQDILINASPETVYDVVSRPEHIANWFAEEVELEPVAGGHGVFRWRDGDGTVTATVPVTVVSADRPNAFSFRWISPERQRSDPAGTEAVLVEFRITAEGGATRLVVCESGLDAVDWDDEAKAAYAADHANGWAGFLPKLRDLAERLDGPGAG